MATKELIVNSSNDRDFYRAAASNKRINSETLALLLDANITARKYLVDSLKKLADDAGLAGNLDLFNQLNTILGGQYARYNNIVFSNEPLYKPMEEV